MYRLAYHAQHASAPSTLRRVPSCDPYMMMGNGTEVLKQAQVSPA